MECNPTFLFMRTHLPKISIFQVQRKELRPFEGDAKLPRSETSWVSLETSIFTDCKHQDVIWCKEAAEKRLGFEGIPNMVQYFKVWKLVV